LKLVVKFGGTSISSVKNIRDVAKYLHDLSKKNQIIVVCSAVSGVTDDLIQISKFIHKGNKDKAKKLTIKIIKKLNSLLMI
jgi:aspartate kinase